MVRTPADVGCVPDPAWPVLPAEILVELEQIEFRVNGTDVRAVRIEELMHKAESLRGEIAEWVRRVRGAEAVA